MKLRYPVVKAIIALAIFCFVGPVVGGFVFLPESALFIFAPSLLLAALLVIYKFGVAPAFLTGMCFAMSSNFIKNRAFCMWLAPVFGAAITFAFVHHLYAGWAEPPHPAPIPGALRNIHPGARLVVAGMMASIISAFLTGRLWRQAGLLGNDVLD